MAESAAAQIETEETKETGLLDNGEPITVEDAIKKADGKEPEKKADVAERPDDVPEKFWDKEKGELRTDDVLKSYKELEKTLKEKGKLPPDAYEFTETFGLPDEEIKQYSEFAKETGLTNAQAEAVMKYAKELGYFDIPDYEAEMAKLGDQKDVVMNTLEAYATQKLLPAERQALEGMVFTAEQAKVLYKIIRASDRSIPAKVGESSGGESKKDLESKLNKVLSEPDIKSNRDRQEEAKALAIKIASM